MKSKHRFSIIALCAALLLSGCAESKPGAVEESSQTSAATESSRESEYTGDKLTIPGDTVLEEAAEALRSSEVWLALNAKGDFIHTDYNELSKSLMLMYFEYSCTERIGSFY